MFLAGENVTCWHVDEVYEGLLEGGGLTSAWCGWQATSQLAEQLGAAGSWQVPRSTFHSRNNNNGGLTDSVVYASRLNPSIHADDKTG